VTTSLAIPDRALAIAARPLDVVLELHELLEAVLPGSPIEGDAARAVHFKMLDVVLKPRPTPAHWALSRIPHKRIALHIRGRRHAQVYAEKWRTQARAACAVHLSLLVNEKES
jgi:hypothetical protein